VESYLPWLALRQIAGVGPVLYKRLIEAFQTPDMVFHADAEALLEVEGISESVAEKIATFTNWDAAKREVDQMEKQGVRLVVLSDPDYPALLRSIYDPPPLLYLKGAALASDTALIAVVGARKITTYGQSVAERIGGGLARVGMVVVSGFAKGIDAVAHRAALSEGGRTIAVLGSGVDCLYPKEHRKLYDAIIEKGSILSEFAMGTEPEPHHFPQRNRIISGLSLGTVVIEASQKSGSLITARHALEQGREVFAVPGSIFSETSSGTHQLIRSGAKLVETVNDILEELSPQLKGVSSESARPENAVSGTRQADRNPEAPSYSNPGLPVVLGQEEEQLYALLSAAPKHIDAIIEESTWETAAVSYRLLELELKGAIRQMAGQFYVRTGE
jgi:DNA processing protein